MGAIILSLVSAFKLSQATMIFRRSLSSGDTSRQSVPPRRNATGARWSRQEAQKQTPSSVEVFPDAGSIPADVKSLVQTNSVAQPDGASSKVRSLASVFDEYLNPISADKDVEIRRKRPLHPSECGKVLLGH